MKKFIIKSVLFVSIGIGICSLIFLNSNNDNLYLKARLDKHSLLDSTSSPKIIFVGGSNVAFGINSQIIRDSTGMNVVNTGLHAGMGIKFILDDLTPYITKMNKRENNYIIICPEYSHFYSNGNGEPITNATLFISDISVVKIMNMQQIIFIIEGLPKYIAGEIWKHIKITGNDENGYKYERKGFNEYGDEINHLTLYDKHPQIDKGKSLGTNLNENTFNYFLKTIKIWDRHAHVLMMPPAIYDESYNVQRNNIQQITERLAKNGFPFIAPTDSFKYDKTLMYNTRYHLNTIGTKLHSKKIAVSLKNYLQTTK